MNLLQSINKRSGVIICGNASERDYLVRKLHTEENMTHLTSGTKSLQDYESRVKRGFYDPNDGPAALVLSFYGVGFFSILQASHKSNVYPRYRASELIPIGPELRFYYTDDGQCRAYYSLQEYLKDKHPATLDQLDVE